MANAVQIAAKLYECRDTARTVLGSRYPEVMAKWGDLIRQVAKRKGIDLIPSAMEIAKESNRSGDGYSTVMVFATAVELVEPSPAIDPDKEKQAEKVMRACGFIA